MRKTTKGDRIAIQNAVLIKLGATGVNPYRVLRLIEIEANRFFLETVSNYIPEKEYNARVSKITKRVVSVFGGNLPHGFLLNADPRGYALKLEIDNQNQDVSTGIHMDFGGYGILAPDF